MPEKIKIAVLVSGNGSNLQAIIDAQANGDLGPAEIGIVISDKPEALALERAAKAGIKSVVVEKTKELSREEYDEKIAGILQEEEIDLIVLAGFMRVLGEKFVGAFKWKIINIHPALLPAFKGTHGIADAFLYGVKVTGVTVHFVDEGVDSGPIIAQRAVKIEDTDTLGSLEERMHHREHELYPEVIRLFAEGRIKLEGRKVKIV